MTKIVTYNSVHKKPTIREQINQFFLRLFLACSIVVFLTCIFMLIGVFAAATVAGFKMVGG